MTGDFCAAVHALTYLNHMGCNLNSAQLAENVCTNPARIRKIMAALHKAGLVETREGGGGGYRFCLEPGEVTLCQVADALDIRIVEPGKPSGDTDMDCQVASGMAGVMTEVCEELDGLCRERLSQMTIRDIDGRIFHKNRVQVKQRKEHDDGNERDERPGV